MGRSHHDQVRPVLRDARGPRQLARCEFGTLGPVVTAAISVIQKFGTIHHS